MLRVDRMVFARPHANFVRRSFASHIARPADAMKASPVGSRHWIGGAAVGHVFRPQHVPINGASGGVGTFAVQIAKSFGAQVMGVCSTRNMDLLRLIDTES